LWASDPEKYQLATAYALSGDRWVSHSWVVDGKTLYETTCPYDRYFGLTLPPFLAFKFWMDNVYAVYYADGNLPPEFFERRPGVVALVEAIGQMPREEFLRRLTAGQRGVAA
jgi:hypothetical protein